MESNSTNKFEGYNGRSFFKSIDYTVPGEHTPGSSGLNVKFEFLELKKEEIKKVVAGCNCTAEVEITDDGINAVYTDSTSRSDVLIMNDKRLTVKKSLTVYMDDGLPLRVKNNKGQSVYNREKASIVLTFGVVLAV